MTLDPDLSFRLANATALLGWVALALSPPSARWAPAVRRIAGRGLPLLFAVLYVALLLVHWPDKGGFGSLADVRTLFDVPGALAAGWVHYLAFDLFVGGWIATRSAELQIPHWQVVPLLLLTFMFGPAGLLAFVALRAVRRPGSLQWAQSAGGAK